ISTGIFIIRFAVRNPTSQQNEIEPLTYLDEVIAIIYIPVGQQRTKYSGQRIGIVKDKTVDATILVKELSLTLDDNFTFLIRPFQAKRFQFVIVIVGKRVNTDQP